MHRSKGLEFDAVYVVTANEGEAPLLRRGQDEAVGDNGENTHAAEEEGDAEQLPRSSQSAAAAHIEEERRLFYVALTRARKELIVSTVAKRGGKPSLPSRFLSELPPDLTQPEDRLKPPPRGPKQQLKKAPERTAGVVAVLGLGGVAERVDEVLDGQEEADELEEEEEEPSGGVIQVDPELKARFLKQLPKPARSFVSRTMHAWARKSMFQEAARLLAKVSLVIDRKLCEAKGKLGGEQAVALRTAKQLLQSPNEEGFAFAGEVIRYETQPRDDRARASIQLQHAFFEMQDKRGPVTAAQADKAADKGGAPSAQQMAALRALGCPDGAKSSGQAALMIQRFKKM
jgi:hypothetical protein